MEGVSAKILFVCTANRFRSPVAACRMSEVLAEARPGESWIISSAGTWAAEGLAVLPSPCWVQSELVLDLAAHRSRCVSAAMLSAADLIAVMEAGHQEALCVEFPEVAARVDLLSSLCGAPPHDIPDPAGFGQDVFLSIGREIVELIDLGWRRICDRALENRRP